MAAKDRALGPEAVSVSHHKGHPALIRWPEGEEDVLWAARAFREDTSWEASPEGGQRDEQG